MKPEAQFEKELATIAPHFNCRYIKIPDTKMINKSNRKTHREDKRPFDGVLITRSGNACIECKINRINLEEHQALNEIMINKINDSFFRLVKRIRKKSVAYQVYKYETMVFETDKIELLFQFFTEQLEKI